MKPKSAIIAFALLISTSLPGAAAPSTVKCAHFDFFVGKRTSELVVTDSRMPGPVTITTIMEGRYDDHGSRFLSSEVTSSPQAPGVVSKTEVEWTVAADHFVGTFRGEQGDISTVKLYQIDSSHWRGEMFSQGTMFVKWTSELIEDSYVSVGEFLDPDGKVVATSRSVTK